MRAVDYNLLKQKKCSKCGDVRDVGCFHKDYSNPGPLATFRYRSQCKDCEHAACREYSSGNRERRNAGLRKWRAANPEKAKANDKRGRYKKLYGLTLDQVEAIKSANGYRCWVCNKSRNALYIDHDHVTGKVRGALCPLCNTFLGKIGDDVATIERMIEYVTSPCHVDILIELLAEVKR